GYHQFAITDPHAQQDAINPGEHPVFLPTPPGTNQAQLIAVLLEYRVIGDPGPLPAAACSLTRAGGIAPQRYQHVQAQTAEPLDPGAFGERAEQTRGQIFIPAPYAA